MVKNTYFPSVLAILTALFAPFLWATDSFPNHAADKATRAAVEKAYGNIPLCFEESTLPEAKYISRNNNFSLFFSPNSAFIVFNAAYPETLDLKLAGSNPGAIVTGEGLLSGRKNYLIGSDPALWKTGVRQFGSIKYAGVYKGIDLVYYGNNRQLEYDFIVSPGADPALIRLNFDGAKELSLDKDGSLVIKLKKAVMIFKAPKLFQRDGDKKIPVSGRYSLDGDTVGFITGSFDRSKELIIDPVLIYSTYLGGGNSDGSYSIAVDSFGNAYITGSAAAITFPTTPGAYQPASGSKVFVTKFSVSGNSLIYSTLIGGMTGTDTGWGIAVNSSGNVFITGSTDSADFPLMLPLQSVKGAGNDCFAAEFSPDGSALVFSTFIGGNSEDSGISIALDAGGNAYIAGFSGSTNLAVTASCFQGNNAGAQDAFVAKINPGGSGLGYLTYLGGNLNDSANSICVDQAGYAYTAGFTTGNTFPITPGAYRTSGAGNKDVFITKINQSGTGLVYSTYAGGSADDTGYAIAVDAAGSVYAAGETDSADFSGTGAGSLQPVKNAMKDAFVIKLNASGSAPDYATYLGGSGIDSAYAIAIDPDGNAYTAGLTQSTDFPLMNPFEASLEAATGKAFVSMLSPSGAAFKFSSYIGGSGYQAAQGVALDSEFNIFITGWTNSTDYPVSAFSYQPSNAGTFDAFISKLTTLNPPTPTVTVTMSATATYTSTGTPSSTQTVSATLTQTSTSTQSPTETEFYTPTQTPFVTSTQTGTNTLTATITPEQSPTVTLTESLTRTMTETTTWTLSETLTQTPTLTTTPTYSSTETEFVTASVTRTMTMTQSATLSMTPSLSPTETEFVTNTVTGTYTATPSPTPTFTQLLTPSETVFVTSSITLSLTMTQSATLSMTPSYSPTETMFVTGTYTATPSLTPTFTQLLTPSETVFVTSSITLTLTMTQSTVLTMTPSYSPTETMFATGTYTGTPSPSPTFTQFLTPSETVVVTSSITLTLTMTPSYSPTETMFATGTYTATPGPVNSFTPFSSPTETVFITASATNTITVTLVPADTLTPVYTAGLSNTMTLTQTFTLQPSITLTMIPSVSTPAFTASLTAFPAATSTITMALTATYAVTVTSTTPTRTTTVVPIVSPTLVPENQLVVYPAPMDSGGNLKYYMADAGTVHIRIYNETGDLSLTSTDYKQAGEQVSNINVSALAFGVYYCLVTRDYNNGKRDGISLKKFMVIH